MINRGNWIRSKEYLEYRLNIDQISPDSLQREETHFRYILEWAQETSFAKADSIRPSLPEFLLNNPLGLRKGQLSEVYIKKILATARRFFIWLSDNKAGHKKIKANWIKTLKSKRIASIPKTREIVTFKEIITIAQIPAKTLSQQRTRAMAVFLYLSGIRIGAFVSLPILAIDIPNRTIKQYPELGVRTKNSKHATTYLWDIPELLEVVQEWDNLVRSVLPESGMWFAPFSPLTGEIDPNNLSSPKTRVSVATKNLRNWLQQNGLPYHSPHKFRHGHIHYGLDRAENRADAKAVSENVMHSSTSTTDQYYANHSDQELKNKLDKIGKSSGEINEIDEDYKEFLRFKAWKRAEKEGC